MKKKLILSSSNKGGSGKSTVARALLGYLRSLRKTDGSPLKVAAYDTDPNVGQLAATYGAKDKAGNYDPRLNNLNPFDGVRMFDARIDSDSFSDTMDSHADIILMDLPGGLLDLGHIFGNIDSFKAQFAKEGYEIIVLNVISQVKASSASVEMIMDIWGDGVKHVVAKNHAYGSDEDFYFFDGEYAERLGNPKEMLIAAGGLVIDFPALDDGAFGLIDAWEVSFEDAVPRLLEKRGEIKGWRIKLSKIETFIKDAAAAFEKMGLAA